MLQWDVWGAMPKPNGRLNDELCAFFDRIAEFTREPDASFAELQQLYARDERLRVPRLVFSAILQKPEVISESTA